MSQKICKTLHLITYCSFVVHEMKGQVRHIALWDTVFYKVYSSKVFSHIQIQSGLNKLLSKDSESDFFHIFYY